MAKGRFIAPAIVIALVALSASPQTAQAQLAGVVVDAQGVLKVRMFRDPGGRLHRQRVAAAKAALERDIARGSELRKVSINRLEAALQDCLDNDRQPTDAMRNLAGLTKLQYIFFYPETKDIVLAGPAEGWVKDLSGRTVGIDSGRPLLELQDLIVALRTFAPTAGDSPLIGVSIDPTKEGLKRMQDFLGSLRNLTPRDAPRITRGLKTSLGLQTVSVRGVSPNTHFAQVLIEADYRMKLIGIGMERPPVKITSFISKADPAGVARNALMRWYFVPNYECVRVSEDDLAMELVGDSVQLLGADEMVSADGRRSATGKTDRATAVFTRSFTKMYGQLAERSPVYAQMRNLIDLAVGAAYIREQGYPSKAGWEMKLFRDEEAYPVETYTTPVNVETAVTSVWKGNRLMTPIGGGVRIEAQRALAGDKLLDDDKGTVKQARAAINPAKIDHNRWWWD